MRPLRAPIAALVLAACGSDLVPESDDGLAPGVDADAGAFQPVGCTPSDPALPPLVEDRRVYREDDLGPREIHVKLSDPQAFAAVNADVPDARAAIAFADGAPPPDLAPANATIRLRGESSRRNEQKSYKIELEGDERWLGQKEINLNKHMWDVTRVRNKLAFDLFEGVAHLTSLRTRFVRMFVDGEDYGLYTWVEEADVRFLASHGLDPRGQLYKPVYFYFQELEPEEIADPELFALAIEGKANPDTDKLLRMIAAVNDEALGTESLVATYFQRDNLLTWMATNLLLNDIDSQTHNYYLYSPSSCEGWYVLPWDYDGAFGFYAQLREDSRRRHEAGFGPWWSSRLWRRFLQQPGNVDAVVERMIELQEGELTDALLAKHVARYRDLVAPFVTRSPDVDHLPLPSAWDEDPRGAWDHEITRITSTVGRFWAEYQEVAERPMPVHLNTLEDEDPPRFRWERAIDLQGDPVTYDFQLSRTEDFGAGDLVRHKPGLTVLETTVAGVPPGTYYWRVIIRDGKTADSFQLPRRGHAAVDLD